MICGAVSCTLPAATFGDYRAKAVDAAEEVISQARTAILTAELTRRDRLLAPAVTVQLQDAETATTEAVDTFASIPPPGGGAGELRAGLLPLMEDVADLITRMRFESEREDTAALQGLRASLVGPTERLEDRIGANA